MGVKPSAVFKSGLSSAEGTAVTLPRASALFGHRCRASLAFHARVVVRQFGGTVSPVAAF